MANRTVGFDMDMQSVFQTSMVACTGIESLRERPHTGLLCLKAALQSLSHALLEASVFCSTCLTCVFRHVFSTAAELRPAHEA